RKKRSDKVIVTPRRRVLAVSSPSPSRLIKTPVTSSRRTAAVYHQARQLFSRCSTGCLFGRDEERSQLSTFLDSALSSKSGGCLYISGPPGTGKSALVNETIETYKARVSLTIINCMSVHSAKELEQKLTFDLEIANFKKAFTSTKKYLVILDEVDHLISFDQELLYRLFEWSLSPKSGLILLSIANALDLTDRFLPRLKSRNLRPQLLPVMPYTAPQIASILTSKLSTLSPNQDLPFFHPAAITFCAKKVSSQTGDLRKAFDICKRAVDLVEQEAAQAELEASPTKPLSENTNLARLSPTTAPKVTIAHVARVTAQVLSNNSIQRLAALNLQQKAVLCALVKGEGGGTVVLKGPSTPKKSDSRAPTVAKLYATYCGLCREERLLQPLTSSEFGEVVSSLEGLGLVEFGEGYGPITPSRTPGRVASPRKWVLEEKRVSSAVGIRELRDAVTGPGAEVLRGML
ncbi:cell division control protein Cdc6, partial [Piedraia hortae CBS 480.64]